LIYYFIYIFKLNLRLVSTEGVLGLGLASQVLGLGGQVFGLEGQVLGLGLVTSGFDSKSAL